MPLKKFIKNSGITNVHGHCLDCGEKWNGGQTALLAIKHHQATGHHIHVEQAIWWERRSKPEKAPKEVNNRKTG
ncbi:MAG: hypothetical protein K9J37_13605 [Saprospiraceae bacterium]|nr:hypothetical protein [Saprospiraceae bacterium]MCF8250945.1 hypothetical protein [Saprospiraceae bacterium]MCF8281922.1 hypothetical protein [Bacteroidales bacterium]MCF8311909.1 hypothetical protein [Saprospiraceae bacterium]MCF8441917.1 hypothetical protein [Saprospiraceae bacterium]